MKANRLNLVLLLGLVAIAGILVVQLLWTREVFNSENKKFSQQVNIVLLKTLERLYEYDNKEFPLVNPIKKISNDYYIVNVNNDFDGGLLEYCLRTEFEKANLLTDFEYAVYQCESDEMVYGNYVSFGNKARSSGAVRFPKHKDLVYYFAIRFPRESSYLLGNLRFWFLSSAVLVLILVIYLYSLFTILQQRKLSSLQRDFINNMTHEFKTPLSSILIASGYLAKQEQITSDERLVKYASIIHDQSEKLNHHIEKLLNIARWDNAPMKLERKPVNVIPLLNKVIDNLQLRHENLHVKVFSEDPQLIIEADEFHFSNLVYNILDNSIKYCETDPEVEISLTKVKGALQMRFSDNGIGVRKKELAFVFDKFYRVPAMHESGPSGFGLGLYYVRKICQMHHWKISALNNLKSGLTILLTIPRSA